MIFLTICWSQLSLWNDDDDMSVIHAKFKWKQRWQCWWQCQAHTSHVQMAGQGQDPHEERQAGTFNIQCYHNITILFVLPPRGLVWSGRLLIHNSQCGPFLVNTVGGFLVIFPRGHVLDCNIVYYTYSNQNAAKMSQERRKEAAKPRRVWIQARSSTDEKKSFRYLRIKNIGFGKEIKQL